MASAPESSNFIGFLCSTGIGLWNLLSCLNSFESRAEFLAVKAIGVGTVRRPRLEFMKGLVWARFHCGLLRAKNTAARQECRTKLIFRSYNQSAKEAG